MTTKTKIEGLDDYELDAWKNRLGSKVVERVAHEERSGSYEIDRAHVLRLANKQFALVTESGFSCYDVNDAVIDLHPTKKAAMDAFDKWSKEK